MVYIKAKKGEEIVYILGTTEREKREYFFVSVPCTNKQNEYLCYCVIIQA